MLAPSHWREEVRVMWFPPVFEEDSVLKALCRAVGEEKEEVAEIAH